MIQIKLIWSIKKVLFLATTAILNGSRIYLTYFKMGATQVPFLSKLIHNHIDIDPVVVVSEEKIKMWTSNRWATDEVRNMTVNSSPWLQSGELKMIEKAVVYLFFQFHFWYFVNALPLAFGTIVLSINNYDNPFQRRNK